MVIMNKSALTGVILACSQLTQHPVRGQEIVHISSEESCRTCSIEVTPVSRIGTLADAFTIHLMTRIVMGATGIAYFAPLYEPGRIAMYDMRAGTVRLIGRPGRGPGEFGLVRAMALGDGDTLFVFEAGRMTKIAPGGKVEAVVPFGSLLARKVLVLPDGRWVVNAAGSTPSSVGLPFHIVDSQGRVLKSFGEDPESQRSPPRFADPAEALAYAGGAMIERDLAHSNGGFFWSAQVLRYEMHLWKPDGTPIRKLVRDAAWFPPRTKPQTTSAGQAPQAPRVASIHQDSRNRLWVAVWVADAKWRPQDPRELIKLDVAWDTVIEVIDLDSSTLLASTRVGGGVVSFLGDDLLVSQEEDSDGLRYLSVSRLRIRR